MDILKQMANSLKNADNLVVDMAQKTVKQRLAETLLHLKKQFNLTRTFYIGNPDLVCENIGILPGAWGGRAHIPFLGKVCF